jgi:hypothetical protein
MTTYLEHVKLHLAASEFVSTELHKNEIESWKERLTPLDARLDKLLSTIPDEIKDEGLSLTNLRTMLSGKWRGKCHPGELGNALRKLGYQRKRNWSKGTQSFNSLWFYAGSKS